MFKFDFFNPKQGPIIVSVADYGITFSKAAIEVMGRPKYIRIGFDKEKCVLGIMPINEEGELQVPFAEKEKHGYIRINNKEIVRFLMKYFDDNCVRNFGSKATRYLTYWDEEQALLVVNMRRPLDREDDSKNTQEKNNAEDETEEDTDEL